MVTSLFAALLALIYFKISFDTIKARSKNKVSLGTGPEELIAPYVSAHSNFSSYVPILLILTYFVENSELIQDLFIYLIASAYTLGRILHYKAMTSNQMNFKLRRIGMMMTLFPLNILALTNIFIFIKVNFL